MLVATRSEFLGCFPERKADSSPRRWRVTLNPVLNASGALHPEPGLGEIWSKNVGCFPEWELVLPEPLCRAQAAMMLSDVLVAVG